MKLQTLAVTLVLLFGLVSSLPASDNKPFDAIDQYAIKASPDDERNIRALVKYLIKPAKNPKEKARAICRWIADRVSYDFDLMKVAIKAQGAKPPGWDLLVAPEYVLKAKKTVCEGYANLFLSMSFHANIPARKITGDFGGGRHGWNAVWLDGKWHLLDVTKMAGKDFDEFWFLTPPDKFIFCNYPDFDNWQLLNSKISKREYLTTPMEKVPFQLLKFGVSGTAVRQMLRRKDFDFVRLFNEKPILIHQPTPIDFNLSVGEEYTFRIESNDYLDMSVQNEGKKRKLDRKGKVFEGKMTTQQGNLMVMGKVKETDTDVSLLLYDVSRVPKTAKPRPGDLPENSEDKKNPPGYPAPPNAVAGQLCAEVINAEGKKQQQALDRLRDAKGTKYTEALAEAIPQLHDADRRKAAREALAERLSRLKDHNLAFYLEDVDAEIRRATALACLSRMPKR